MAAQGGGAAVRRHRFFKILYPGSFESSACRRSSRRVSGVRGARAATATLRDPAGRPWDVELDRHSDGDVVRLCFAGRGWRRFVAGSGISGGNLLVFDHLGGLEFAVELFEASGCSLSDVDGTADGHHGTRTSRSRDNNNTASDMESGSHCDDWSYAGIKRKWSPPVTADTSAAGSCERSEEGETPTLRRRIQWPFQLQYLDLTKSFCDRMGWTSSRSAQVTVAGGERRWEVTVKVGQKGGMVMRGWTEFAQDNGIRISDTCVFLRPGTTGHQLVQVQVLKGQLTLIRTKKASGT